MAWSLLPRSMCWHPREWTTTPRNPQVSARWQAETPQRWQMPVAVWVAWSRHLKSASKLPIPDLSKVCHRRRLQSSDWAYCLFALNK